MEATAVIPNWNGGGKLALLLDDLHAQTRQPVSIVVVDNGSTDGSDHAAESAGATVVRFSENRGFAKAVNRGVSDSATKWIAILNNDIRLPKQWLEALLEGAESKGSPFALGKMMSLGNPEALDSCFDAISRGGCAWRCGQGRLDGPVWSEPRAVQLPPFTAVLLQRDYYLRVGGLDESFGSYLEDVDFGLRSASHGYSGHYFPHVVGYHEGSSTLGVWGPDKVRQIAKNQVLIVAKHYSARMLVRFGWPIAVSHLLWGLVALRHGAGVAWFKGKIDGLRQFATHRRGGDSTVEHVLGSSEKELLALQQLTGWDLYWRIYAALT